MPVWHHPIHSELDYIPCMDITIEFYVSSNHQLKTYIKQGITEEKVSTSGFDFIIRQLRMIGQIMNVDSEYSKGVAKITYNGKTYNMRNEDEIKELKRVAIHYVGLPDL